MSREVGGAEETDARSARRPGPAARAHWRSSLRAMAALLLVWFLVSYVLGIGLVEPLNAHRFGGFPLGFWFAQQGSIYVFVVLIFVYARWMDRADRRYAQSERQGPDPAAADAAAPEPQSEPRP